MIVRWVISAALFCVSLAASAAASLFVIGDTGDCGEGPPLVANALMRHAAVGHGWLLEVGDLAYPVATVERLRECHEPFFGRQLFPRRLAVPGNHEVADPGLAGFRSIYPETLPRTIEIGAWKGLLLDSNLRGDAWERQLTWAEEVIRESEGRCLFAVWHHPTWSSGRRGDNPEMQRLWAAVAGGATFTLHGHDHHYERLAPRDGVGRRSGKGAASFIAGNGGASLYPLAPQLKEGSQAVAGEWGYLAIHLEETEFRWQARTVSGATIDQGRAPCRPVSGL